jgi:hypothetical protein
VTFNNHVAGSVVTHIYAPYASNPSIQQSGNGSADFPAGDGGHWFGWTLLTGSGFTAQLWAAPGLNQPESSLVPASPTTVMRTGPAAGYVAGVTASLPNVPESSTAGATVEVRVWDNQGGSITTWATALIAWQADTTGSYAVASSPLFDITAVIGSPFTSPTILIGLQSFNIYTAIPEPSTFALAALGSAVLLICRRQGRVSVRVRPARTTEHRHEIHKL